MDVRQGREGLELRVDGTLASLQRTGGRLTGTVWWALASPIVLARPGKRPRQALILGLAAGSVAAALRELDPGIRIVGVEKDGDVLEAARRHFALDRLGVELEVVDAREYLARERRRFDLIIEDLFVGPSRTVHKPDWLLGEGYAAIRRRLAGGGFVSANTIHEMPAVARAMHPFEGRVLSLDVRGHWNRITLCGRDLPTPRELRRTLAAHPRLGAMLKQVAIRSR